MTTQAPIGCTFGLLETPTICYHFILSWFQNKFKIKYFQIITTIKIIKNHNCSFELTVVAHQGSPSKLISLECKKKDHHIHCYQILYIIYKQWYFTSKFIYLPKFGVDHWRLCTVQIFYAFMNERKSTRFPFSRAHHSINFRIFRHWKP